MSRLMMFVVFAILLVAPTFAKMPEQTNTNVNSGRYGRTTKEPTANPSGNMMMMVMKVVAMAMQWLNTIQDYVVDNVGRMFGFNVDKQLVRSAMGSVRTKALDYVRSISILQDYLWIVDSVSMLV